MSLLHIVGETKPTPVGQAVYTAVGARTWVCPADVTSVCVVCVGGGAYGEPSHGGSGGGLGWKNNIPVTPGQSYSLFVGNYGQDSYFINTSTVKGGGASRDVGGTYVGDGGGNGGASYFAGGGAGGYSGDGGTATSSSNPTLNAGKGGGGGSGGYGLYPAGGGGGVGILGQGANGGVYSAGTTDQYGTGGSGGADGSPAGALGGAGGLYGGGGGCGTGASGGAAGKAGAVRIIWGANRAFPSTNTGDL